ncbi:MAG: endolytic transglycosylase MltG [Clostridia bacterium]|nr:endolytic transglycosylase MltG [Clostridia bacterium]
MDLPPQAKKTLKTPVRQTPPQAAEGSLSGVFKAIVYITAVLVVSIFLSYLIITRANDVFAFVKPDVEVEVTIPEDTTVAQLSHILGNADVIRYPSLFRLYAKLKGEDGKDKDGNSVFIPGTYTVSPMKNYMQLLSLFQKQRRREVVWVTIPEGSTVEDIILLLTETYGISDRASLTKAINEYDYGFDFLEGLEGPPRRHYRLEGYLFPDTYQFYTDSSAETVVYRMLQNFKSKLRYIGNDYGKARLDELGMTLDEVVTLASMVEKEVKYAVDYENVASVFHNRLAHTGDYPRLDSDATTVYAIWMATGTRPESLGAEELAFDDPYNTRASAGLPPGAIANPGYEALYCAFYPAKTNYYYFVADNTGYNLYARTAAGHAQNVASVRKESK